MKTNLGQKYWREEWRNNNLIEKAQNKIFIEWKNSKKKKVFFL